MSRVTDSGFPAYTRLYKQHLQGSGSGINTQGQTLEERATFRVAAVDYSTFMGFVFGKPETVGGYSGALIRNVPLRHPDFDKLLATSYNSSTVGFLKGATAALNYWAWRDVQIAFSPPDFSLDGQNAFVSVQTSVANRTIEAPPSMFAIGGLAPVYDPQFEVPGTNLSLTLHQLTSLPLSTFALYQRHVNLTSFWGYGAGELLYMGLGSNRTLQFGATTSFEVTHEFVWSSIPWNQGFTPAGALSELTYASGTKRYPTIEFANLFS